MRSKKIIEAEVSLLDILNFVPDPTLAVDRAGRVIYWNKAIEKMTGVKAKNMVGKGNYEYALPFYGARRPILLDFIFKYKKTLEKKYHFIKRNGAVLTTEADVPVRGGKPRVLWAIASPLYDPSGKTIGAIESIRDITDRKKIELNLKESERQYSELFNRAVDAIFIADPATKKLVNCNKAAEELMGYSRAKILSMKAGDLHPKDKAKETMRGFEEQAKGKIKQVFSEVLTKGNKRIPVAINAALVHIQNRPYLQGIFRNIAEQKIIEDRLKESEEKYRNLISNLPKTEYVWVYRNGRLLWVNNNTPSFLGYSRKKIIGTPLVKYIEKKYQKIVLENIRKREAGKKVDDYAIKIKNKKGRTRDVLVKGSVINYEGRPAALLILSDIADLVKKDKELEAVNSKLERSQKAILNVLKDIERQRDISYKQNIELAKFKLAVDNASDDIVITDPKGIVLYANPAFEINNGYSLSEIIGKTPAIWGGQMSREFYKDFWKMILKEKDPFKGEVTNKRKNGELYAAELKVSPILNDKSEVEFFVGISRDITKLKELDRAKSEFVSVASHQLKTPLTGMKWVLESILKNRENNLTEKQQADLWDVYGNNERMIALINDLLNISRIDSGKYAVLNLKKVDMARLIERAIKNLAFFAADRKVKIVFNNRLFENNSLIIDEEKISQVVLNLISNSIKYSRSEGGMIEITAGIKNREFIFSIKDNGAGIPARNQRHIFEKFFRADNAAVFQAGGSGLGLYIAKYFVENHKGRIWFRSKEGVGTTFCFTLSRNLI